MKICKLKTIAVLSILSVTLTVVIAMSLLTGLGAVEAGIDIAVVTIGINGIISVIKLPSIGTEKKGGGYEES